MPRRDSEVYPKRKPLKDFTSGNDELKLIPIIPSSAHFVEMDERKKKEGVQGLPSGSFLLYLSEVTVAFLADGGRGGRK